MEVITSTNEDIELEVLKTLVAVLETAPIKPSCMKTNSSAKATPAIETRVFAIDVAGCTEQRKSSWLGRWRLGGVFSRTGNGAKLNLNGHLQL